MNQKLYLSCLAFLTLAASCSSDVIGTGSICTTDDDCEPSFYCRDDACVQKSDVGGDCNNSKDCMEPYVCQDNVCILGDTPEPPEPDTCSDDKPCEEGVCVDGSCVVMGTMGDPCDMDEDCQDDLTCHDEVCMNGAGLGESCSDAHTFCTKGQCLSGTCTDISGIIDTDGDTIADTYDACDVDTDNDTTPDCQDLDADNDTIPDSIEARNDGNPSLKPADSDHNREYDFMSPDSDRNGIPDMYEGCPDPLFPYTGPDSPKPTAVCEAPIDTDGDTLPDYLDDDNDGDATVDFIEIYGITTNTTPSVPGRKCGNEPCAAGTTYAPWDSDGDTIYDYNDTDSDNDMLPDELEGVNDSNHDNVLDRYSVDSDGDTLPDGQEVGTDGLPLKFETSAGDTIYCFQSIDCDLDGLKDDSEPVCNGVSGVNNPDTDGDSFMDTSELAAGIYAAEHGLLDGSSIADANSIVCDPNLGVTDVFDFYFELPWQGPQKDDLLEFIPKVSKLDLVFNVDTTGSMTQAIQNVKNNVGNIIHQVQSMVPDSGFALVNFDDYPTGVGYMGHLSDGTPVVYPYGEASSGDLPFRVLGKISTKQSVVQGYTQNSLFTTRNGADGAESGTESLHHILTGKGTQWTAGNYTGYFLYSSNQAYYTTFSWSSGNIPDNVNAPNTWGGVDFRSGSLPVIVHTTDVYSHDRSSVYNYAVQNEFAYNNYNNSIPNPHYTADIVPKFKETGARVITLGVPNQNGQVLANEMNQMTTWARESNAIVPACAFEGACGYNKCCLGSQTVASETINGRDNQCILYYTSAQTDVSTYITKGVDALVKYGTYEVATQIIGEPIPGSSVDTSCFIKQVTATAYIAPPNEPEKSCNPVAEPTSVNGANYLNGFENFAPGTSDPNREGAKLHFTVYAQNDNCVPATEEAQIFRAYIDVINPTTGLVFGKRQVSIIVPGEINHDQIN